MSRVIRGPGGSNAYSGPTGGESAGLSRNTQAFPVDMGPAIERCSTKNRKSKRISGPSYSSAKELDYRGT